MPCIIVRNDQTPETVLNIPLGKHERAVSGLSAGNRGDNAPEYPPHLFHRFMIGHGGSRLINARKGEPVDAELEGEVKDGSEGTAFVGDSRQGGDF